MEPAAASTTQDVASRRGRARRSALVLGLLALGLYVGFIAMQVLHARAG